MTRKDYNRAIAIVKTSNLSGGSAWQQRQAIEDAFFALFKDNNGFDEIKFRTACRI